MAVKVQRLVEYEQNNEIEVLLFADTKDEVSSDMNIDGIPKGKVISYGSSLITADGDLAFLKSDGTWNFTKSGGGSDPKLEDKSVEPDFSDGDVTVEPSEGYDGLSSVTITKDSDLVAENIKKDVEVFGVTGTFEGDGQASEDLKALVERTITTLSNDDITSVGNNAFPGCDNLTSVSLPNATSIGAYVFQICTSLASISLPKVTTIGAYAFNGCTKLTDVSLQNATTISNYAFNGCTLLNTIILGLTTEICTLYNTNPFNGTAFASGKSGGTLYVPQDLIASYQADATWSAILSANPNNQILAIEGSIYEQV